MIKKYPPITKVPHFLHGGDYNPDQWMQWKETIWKEDMRMAKLAGCNAMSVAIFSWSNLEPEDGVYTFEWLDELMDLLAQNGMYAVLATPSGARPVWMAQKYPEVLRVTADRHRNLYGRRHNHCFTSPVYRTKANEMNRRLAERYKDHPALIAWHISNELGGDCHCPLCQEAFRHWVQEQYGTLDAVNTAWWTAFWSHRYTDWSQVESPSPRGEDIVHGLNLAWKRFVTDQTIDFYRNEIAPLRELTPAIPITTNFMELFEGLDYGKFAKEVDVVSWDNYPRWRATDADEDVACFAAFNHDIMRSLKGGKPFMLMESSPSSTNWQPPAKLRRPGGHKLYSLQAVAHGSDTVQYFQMRKSRGSSEKLHGAVIDHVGHENTRVFREIADLGQQLTKLDEVLGCTVQAKIALIYDVQNRWAINDTQGMQVPKGYESTVLDWYKQLWKKGYMVDIVDEDSDFSKYDVLVSPMMYMVRTGVGERIEQFVNQGGTFVATYITGWVDENDLCYLGGWPGPLKKVLGVWCEELDSLYPEDRNAVIMADGSRYCVDTYCDIIHLEGAKELGHYESDFYAGMPAVTCNEFGEGKAYFVAAKCEDQFISDFLSKIAEEKEVAPVLPVIPEGVSVTARTDGENEFVFVMNFFMREAQISVEEGGVSLLTGNKLSGTITLPALGIEIYKR